MLYVCERGVMNVVFFLYCDACSCMCSCMGSMSVSSCRYCLCLVCILWQFLILHNLPFVICVGHDQNWCSRWSYVCSVYVE